MFACCLMQTILAGANNVRKYELNSEGISSGQTGNFSIYWLTQLCQIAHCRVIASLPRGVLGDFNAMALDDLVLLAKCFQRLGILIFARTRSSSCSRVSAS
jgi:hypothetical protein